MQRLCLSDMWAMGAIMAELFTLRPLFPGARYALISFHSYSFVALERTKNLRHLMTVNLLITILLIIIMQTVKQMRYTKSVA